MDRDGFSELIKNNDAVLVYFSTPQCSVCKTLRPKIEKLLQERFPLLVFQYIDCEQDKELAAQNSIFAVPSLVIYLAGKESFRKSRFVGVDELAAELERPYHLMFD